MPRSLQQDRVVFEDNRLVPSLYGEHNAHLRTIGEVLDIQINSRGNEVTLSGDVLQIERAKQVLETLWAKLRQGQPVDATTVDSALRFSNGERRKNGNGHGNGATLGQDESGVILTRKKRIEPRTPTQAAYIKSIQTHNLTFGIGPAGTGKTYLAVAMAAAALEAGKVERIILSRPAVEAGEKIGFLPGEMKDKMDPYMRPLYDALHDTMGSEKMQKRILAEEIEIAPLAFMRGRTLANSFIILDEAQNTTTMQMMMFLTRMGEGSHMVVTGDPSQTDLPSHQPSGLKEAMQFLHNVEGISFTTFTSSDVVRHPLVTKIIQAYEKNRA